MVYSFFFSKVNVEYLIDREMINRNIRLACNSTHLSPINGSVRQKGNCTSCEDSESCLSGLCGLSPKLSRGSANSKA